MGVAVSEDGGEQGSMGVAVGDYDGSGRLSLYITNFAEEYNSLYHNDGDHFTDVSFRSKTAPASLPYVGWGTAFLDYDNDGWLDIIAVNGHVYPQLDQARRGASAPYRQRKLLYHNRGDGTFDEVAAQFGPVLTEERVSRGLAVGDLDNDGRLDVVINDLDGSPQVLRNELAGAGNWLIVKLKGKGRNTDAIGAVVKVKAGKLNLMRLVQSGTSYLSQDDMRPPLRPRRGEAGRFRRGPLAGRDHHPAREGEGRPGRRRSGSRKAGWAVTRAGPARRAVAPAGAFELPWSPAAGCPRVGPPGPARTPRSRPARERCGRRSGVPAPRGALPG